MSGAALWPWLALLGLGALHGLNPGMGWLFAVALGVQQGEGRAVWRALPPLAAGHALAVAAAVAAALWLGLVVPAGALRWLAAGALAALGVRQLRRHRHPRYGGMRVGARELTAWSFLVATAHGAGLMAAPFAVRAQGGAGVGHGHGAHAAAHLAAPADGPALAATAVHTAGYLLVTALLAAAVYGRASRGAGLGVLRRAWVNVDLVWAAALVVSAVVVAFA